MTGERMQRRIDRLLDQADEAAEAMDWSRVRQAAEAVLAVDADNDDAVTFIAMSERAGAVDGGTAAVPVEPVRTTAEPSDVDTVPTSFANDRYQISKFLGEGGKKRVYQAHDTLLDREVAFALIKTEGFDQTSKERISREAQAMGRLGVHPNIVAVLDLGQEDDGTPYMVAELMRGGDVEGLLEDVADKNPVSADSDPPEGGPLPAATRAGGLPLDRTIEIAKAVCEGLEFAHARGIVHRDLKPGNVWLTEDGTAKIGDFGLAVMTDRSRLTREGMMVGTVSYMPPEQATGGDITPKADLYSLGAMLYEMVTGRPPFLGDDEIAIIGQHINTPPVAPSWYNGNCPRPLEALIMRLLSKDPAERPESAQDVFNALDAIDLTARGETVEHEGTSLESLAGGVFVGRQAEMDQLKAALEDVLGGRGRLVTLVGEPGIGKTRTSEELATYAGLRGAKVLWGRCYEGGGAPPYWPWVQAIRSYVRETDPDELRRQMGSSASVIAEIVTDVTDRLPEVGPPSDMDDPAAARFRLFDAFASFLRTASEDHPLVLILDDLHWSDEPSLALLEFVAREIGQSRVLLVGTYRDMELNGRHPLTVMLGDLRRERLFEEIQLRGLTEQDVARFIEIAAGFQPPPGLIATVHRHTEGNPLFVTEVVRDLVQAGELTEEKISGAASWSVRIPEGVREVIGRRLNRLSDRANEIFTTAAVVGRIFTLDALKELTEDTSEDQLLDVLDEALNAKLIEGLPEQVGLYQFTHTLIQETLLGELSVTQRVRLHARIAETLERLYGAQAEEHASELAYHFGEAEAVLGSEKLLRYSDIAREQSEALAHFEQAEANQRGGEDESLSREPEAAVVRPGTFAGLNRRAEKYWELGRTDEAVDLWAEILPKVEQTLGEEHPDTLAARNNLAVGNWTLGNRQDAIDLWEGTIAVLARVQGSEHPNTLTARNNLAVGYAAVSRLGEAVALYEELLRVRERVLGAEHPDTLLTRSNLAAAYRDQGRLGKAVAMSEALVDVQDRVLGAEHPDALTTRNNLAVMYVATGRRDLALALSKQVVDVRERVLGFEHPDTLSAENNLAVSYAAMGLLVEAERLHRRIFLVMERTLGPAHPDTARTRRNLADVLLIRSNREEAVELYEDALQKLERVRGPDHPETVEARSYLNTIQTPSTEPQQLDV